MNFGILETEINAFSLKKKGVKDWSENLEIELTSEETSC